MTARQPAAVLSNAGVVTFWQLANHVVNARQAHALTHPLEYAEGVISDEFRSIDLQPDGNLLVIILAVDR